MDTNGHEFIKQFSAGYLYRWGSRQRVFSCDFSSSPTASASKGSLAQPINLKAHRLLKALHHSCRFVSIRG